MSYVAFSGDFGAFVGSFLGECQQLITSISQQSSWISLYYLVLSIVFLPEQNLTSNLSDSATPLFATFNAQRVIITCMLCCGIFNILIPHGTTPFMVASFAFFNGCFFGVQEIGEFTSFVFDSDRVSHSNSGRD